MLDLSRQVGNKLVIDGNITVTTGVAVRAGNSSLIMAPGNCKGCPK